VSEEVEIRNAVKSIRDKEKSVSKKHPFGKYLTYWDADEARVILFDRIVRMETRYGQDAYVTGALNKPASKSVMFDVDHIIALQFSTTDHIDAIFKTQEAFKSDGTVMVGEIAAEGLTSIRTYCQKVDQVIRDEGFRLRDLGIKNIFSKMYREMGGDMISESDRVGKRVKFFGEIASLYNTDKNRWKPMLVKLGLLGDK
jgi:hypothetical protein